MKAPRSCHITAILRSRHWLRITERIEYKLLSLTYKVLTTTQPPYLHNLISTKRPRSTRSSCVVTLARPELHAGPNFKIRPDPAHENCDPTRPDDYPWWAKKALLLHDALSSAYTQVTSSTRKTIRSSYAVTALYQLLPETLHCDDWVPTNMYARNVRGMAVELSLMIRPWSCN